MLFRSLLLVRPPPRIRIQIFRPHLCTCSYSFRISSTPFPASMSVEALVFPFGTERHRARVDDAQARHAEHRQLPVEDGEAVVGAPHRVRPAQVDPITCLPHNASPVTVRSKDVKTRAFQTRARGAQSLNAVVFSIMGSPRRIPSTRTSTSWGWLSSWKSIRAPRPGARRLRPAALSRESSIGIGYRMVRKRNYSYARATSVLYRP